MDGHLYRRPGRRIWQLKYYRHGRPIYESARTSSYTEAKRLLRLRTGAIAKGETVSPRMNQYRFDEAIAAVLADFQINGRKSLDDAKRRVRLHLLPYFGGRRMVAIDADLIRRYIVQRKAELLVTGTGESRRARPPSNGTINRELQLLIRAFSLAMKDGILLAKPVVPLLVERNVRSGFLEAAQLAAVCRHLAPELAAVVRFAAITGWRIDSEVLPLEWRQVDLDATLSPAQPVPGVVRLEPGTTKNTEGRSFPCTAALRAVLLERHAATVAAQTAGRIVPWVFFRMIAIGRGAPTRPVPIRSLTKAWRAACQAAGCPGRIPHDLRRTAVRNLVRAGVPQSVAMKLTGHKTDAVFRRYAIVSTVDLAAAAATLDRHATG